MPERTALFKSKPHHSLSLNLKADNNSLKNLYMFAYFDHDAKSYVLATVTAVDEWLRQ